MNAIKVRELLGVLAVFLNVVIMLMWGIARPTSAYERTAFERLEEGKSSYRRGHYEKAFAYYDDVSSNFRDSKFSERALFLAGRTALRRLGQLDLARERFHEYTRLYPQGQNVDAARRYCDLLASVPNVDAVIADSVLWEFVQAEREHEDGHDFEALNRCEWITTHYAKTRLNVHALRLATAIKGDLTNRYLRNGQASEGSF